MHSEAITCTRCLQIYNTDEEIDCLIDTDQTGMVRLMDRRIDNIDFNTVNKWLYMTCSNCGHKFNLKVFKESIKEIDNQLIEFKYEPSMDITDYIRVRAPYIPNWVKPLKDSLGLFLIDKIGTYIVNYDYAYVKMFMSYIAKTEPNWYMWKSVRTNSYRFARWLYTIDKSEICGGNDLADINIWL